MTRSPVVRQAERRKKQRFHPIESRSNPDRRQPAEGVMDLQRIEELSERSKNDRAIIVGSEVRWLCMLALRGLQGPTPEEVKIAEHIRRYSDETSNESILARAILRWEGKP